MVSVAPRRPVVGIGPDFLPARGWTKYTVYDRYLVALRRAGALPVLLEPETSEIEEQLALVDGVLLAGGDDLDPSSWGEEPVASHEPSDPRRSRYELALVRACLGADKPLLGICLGLQTMNVALGGSLVQELPPSALEHQDRDSDLGLRHELRLEAGSRLAAALERPRGGRVSVNSFHRQAPGRVGEGLVVSARAPDGVIEALEHPDRRFFVGVQWHPDADEGSEGLFRAFVDACRPAGSGSP